MKIELSRVTPALDSYQEMRVVMQRMAQALAAGKYMLLPEYTGKRLTHGEMTKLATMEETLAALNAAQLGRVEVSPTAYEPWSTAVYGDPRAYVTAPVGTQVETNLDR